MRRTTTLAACLLTLLIAACGPPPEPTVSAAATAAAYCQEQGYEFLPLNTEDSAPDGLCLFPDGSQCPVQPFFQGACAPGDSLASAESAPSGTDAPPTTDPATEAPAPTTVARPQTVNVAQAAGLRDAVALRLVANSAPDRALVVVDSAELLARIVTLLDRELTLGPAAACAATHSAVFELADGTEQTFGLACDGTDPTRLRGAQPFFAGQDIAVVAELATLLQAQLAAAGAVPTVAAEEAADDDPNAVAGWVGTLPQAPYGQQSGNVFERDDGTRYTLATDDDGLQAVIDQARWLGSPVMVWGRVDSAESTTVALERIDATGGPTAAPRNLSYHAAVEASSELPADNLGVYHAWSAVDGALTTTWTEGVPGDGSGEWLRFTFPGPVRLQELRIDVGYDYSETIFLANNRVQTARIVFDDGSALALTLADARGLQTVALADLGPVPATTSVQLIIDSVYPGTTYDDACIAEVEWWGVTE